MSRIGIVTTTRADYGIYRPLLSALRDAHYDICILAGGTHREREFGRTFDQIVGDNWGRIAIVEHYVPADGNTAIAFSCGRAVHGFAEAIESGRPDLLFVLGDRYEMLAAGLAAALMKTPIAHLHGGDVTEGSYDDQFRHALTKLSHVHFPALREHAARIVAMGEEDWRVRAVGSLALDALAEFEPEPLDKIAAEAGLDATTASIVVLFHPETLGWASPEEAFARVAEGLWAFRGNVVLVGTNADEGHLQLRQAMQAWADQRRRESRGRTATAASMEQRRFWSWLHHASALVGNSSSGIIEAPSVRVPVVNIGDRQKGRVRARNVIDVDCNSKAIASALTTALSPAFRQSLKDVTNPYGDGRAAKQILSVIADLPAREVLLRKRWRLADSPAV